MNKLLSLLSGVLLLVTTVSGYVQFAKQSHPHKIVAPDTSSWEPIAVTVGETTPVTGTWQTVASANGSAPTARHENAFVKALDKFFLIGGRGNKPVEMYDLVAATWSNAGAMPLEMHHFQAVEYNAQIYVVGAFTGGFPNETPVPNIYIYNPNTKQWSVGPEIPANRRRGSAGVVVFNNKIYMVAGIQNGHVSGHVPWFDEFDPATNTWRTLPDAPRARDHFHAAMIGTKLYAAGGRNTGKTSLFGDVIAEVDVYDFATGQWSTMPNNLPTLRAGVSVVPVGDELLVIGGESAQDLAHNQTEALNATTGVWRTLANLITGRHGAQAIVHNGGVYIAAGSGGRGGGPELTSQEVYLWGSDTGPTASPTNLSFGQVAINSASSKTVTLSNPGLQDITLSAITATGAAEYSQSFANALPFILKPSLSAGVNVTFTPTTSGVKTGQLEVTHTGVNGKLTIALTGEGITTANQPPVVVAPLADLMVNQDAPASSINLATVFHDAEQGQNLLLSIAGNNNPGLVTPSLNGVLLTLSYTPGQQGAATLVIRATDNSNAFIEDSFVVTISEPGQEKDLFLPLVRG